MSDCCTIYMTAPDQAEARNIARELLHARLAACVNIFDPIHSLYHWEGQVQEEQEVALLIKTRQELVQSLISEVTKLHSYDCPCITVWPIVEGNPDYLDWIKQETTATKQD